MSKDNINDVRRQIDKVDADILRALSQRADLAKQIGRIKDSNDPNGEVYSSDREASHLRELAEANHSEIEGSSIATIFREIMSACRALERQLNIAYLGPQGTYTMEAVYRQFGHSITMTSLPNIQEVFSTVENGKANYGVVPVENSSAGSVTDTLDCFMVSPLQIIGEVTMRINHCLMSHSGQHSDITTVYAHEQSLAQCRKWLDSNLPHCQRVGLPSNAAAAHKVAEDKSAAAIASASVAAMENIPVLASNIEDSSDNTTRFVTIGKHSPGSSGDDKTSIIVSTQNESGALAGLLKVLADHDISMTHIESRPSHTSNWEYLFFLDIAGHCDDPAIAKGLSEIKAKASFYKHLGSYPTAN